MVRQKLCALSELTDDNPPEVILCRSWVMLEDNSAASLCDTCKDGSVFEGSATREVVSKNVETPEENVEKTSMSETGSTNTAFDKEEGSEEDSDENGICVFERGVR